MNKIVILGGSGFLGQNLNKVFANNSNYEVYNISRRTGCDILEIDQLIEVLKSIRPTYLINAAAHVGSMPYVSRFSADVCNDNSQMYLNIFKAILRVDPGIILINPISNCSYPGIIDIQHEELWWEGVIHESVESYGNPKKIGYILSECYKKQYNIKTINLILPNAYGPLDYADESRTHAMNGIIMRMIKAVENGDMEFVVWGSGTPIREWIYMEDAAKIIKTIILENKIDLPNPINIGQEVGISINESVGLIKNKLGTNISVKNDLTKPDGAPIKILGSKKFNKHFPDFKFTSYSEGILNTINYYKKVL